MLNLPHSTEVSQPLPKAQIFKKFELKASQREAFDTDVAKMEIVNAIIPQTLPAIAVGNEVKGIFVVKVELKRRDFDTKNITLIAKLIPQKIVFMLCFEDKFQLAVYNTKLFLSPWYTSESAIPKLLETNSTLDHIWDSVVAKIGQLEVLEGQKLSEAIEIVEKRQKLTSLLEQLNRKLRNTSQNHQQLEIFSEIKKVKAELQKFNK